MQSLLCYNDPQSISHLKRIEGIIRLTRVAIENESTNSTPMLNIGNSAGQRTNFERIEICIAPVSRVTIATPYLC
jgi:fructose-1,6-bisphosphatase/sedoheptulose 1,7-bisphosphatase-like protein